ncbi:germination protein YpeB [Thermoflavimicrobium dichotomicum]|uniref:Spore germination protein n=1 Tax=Thermoflavimicrobium dichotomicum TaxID=46223 RepID=A0A1I3SHD7_9BACL|nr:germination protein YpeB [Thermoflavimicrobium dichotomicum]SFJ57502.1 spore germination protein [Thermoflavimicrobium dichotomicum]
MYRTVAAFLFPITLIAFIGTAIWGYRENQEKNSILIKAENQYQRAFHDLNDHMDKLQDEMGKALALNSQRQLSNCMTNVWRLAYAAQEDLGQLPLTLMPFDKAETFLGKIGSFSHQVGVRDLNKEPLSDKEWNTLQTLYNRAHDIRNDLHQVQDQVLNKNLRWMDVELAMASEDKKMDNAIIDGFQQVNKMVEQYPEVDWGPAITNMEVHKREKYKKLQGREISLQEAKQKVAQAFDVRSTSGMKATVNGKGGDYQTISVTFDKNGNTAYTDLTKKGGHIIFMMLDRPVKQAKLNLDQAEQVALRFLERLGLKNMVATSYDETGNMFALNFVHQEKGIYIYPEMVAVKVARDNGEIVGLQADEYVFNKITPIIDKPKLTEAEAKKRISPKLKVQKTNLAYIYDQTSKPVLCYEFLGMIGKEQYRVFVNAMTGSEEKVEKIRKADADHV